MAKAKKKAITSVADDPGVQAAEEHLAGLHERQSECQATILRCENEMQSGVREEAAVSALLASGGDDAGQVAELLGADAELCQQRDEAKAAMRTLERAIVIQRQRVEAARREAGRLVLKVLEPGHRELTRNIVQALLALDAALIAEAEYTRDARRRSGLPLHNVAFTPFAQKRRNGESLVVHEYITRLGRIGYGSATETDDNGQ